MPKVCLSTLLVLLVACSSSGGSGSSGGGSSSSGTGGGGGGGTSSGGSCSCAITYNSVAGSLDCGKSGCINGENFSCASDGSGASDQGACTAAQNDAGSSSGGSSSGSSCTKLGGSSCEKDADCCSGLSCYAQGCYVTAGGACTADDQCQPDDPPFVGQSCGGAHTCCGKTNYACVQQGPDPFCCSGTCGAPNSSGISFCN